MARHAGGKRARYDCRVEEAGTHAHQRCNAQTASIPNCLWRFRRVIALEPPAQSIETWEQGPLVDIGLIELVAHFPLQLSGNNDAAAQVRVRLEPRVEARGGIRHQREERELVQDARVERRWLDEEHEWL